MEALKDKIIEKLKAYFEGSDFFLVDVKIATGDRITVYMDGKENITIDKCVEVSRMLENYLEEGRLVREDYKLEVSSPGMGQPFRVYEQFEKSLNRSLDVLRKDGIRYEGIVTKVNPEGIRIRVDKMKKGKVIDSNDVDLAFEEIKTAKQLITFK